MTEETCGLVDFLRARYGEEEHLARRLAARYVVRNPDHPENGQPYWPLPSVEPRFQSDDPDIAAGLDLVRLYSPQRALAEAGAKRRITALHAPEVRSVAAPPYDDCTGAARSREYEVTCPVCGWASSDPTSGCETLRLLAVPYAGHPGYRPEWRPDCQDGE
jgi:hypothetical protein